MANASLHQRDSIIGFCLVLLGALGFAAKAIFVKLTYAVSGDVDAITLMALRMAFSLPFFLVVAVWHNRKSDAAPLDKKQWAVIVVLGLMGYYISSYLDFMGLQYISAGLERVILFMYPTFVVLFSALVHKRKITAQTVIALTLSYSGLLLVFVEHLSLESSHVWLGSGLVLGSAVVFACFTMGSGVMTHRIGSARFTAYTMTVAVIATLVHFAVQYGVTPDRLPALPYAEWKRVCSLAFIMAIFSTVLPAFFMNAGIRRVGAGTASIISMTGPIVTLALAYWLLDEAVTALQLAGVFIVLAGVYRVSPAK